MKKSALKLRSRSQSGSALVVGLILLVAISLMAISSLNTATLDLIMAGNEQYHNRAFHAAESGIERAWNMNSSAYMTASGYPTSAGLTAAETTTGNDVFKYKISQGVAGGAVANSSGSAIYFRIESRGYSDRGAVSIHVQELYTPSLLDLDMGPVKSPSGLDICGVASLDSTLSAC